MAGRRNWMMPKASGQTNCPASYNPSKPLKKKTATGEKPFMLTYGSEVVLPIEVGLHTHRLTTFQESLNNAAL